MTKHNDRKHVRGFAAMSPEKQREIASKGGSAYHKRRGFQAMDPEEQREIARKGGSAPHEIRGFQAMDPEEHRAIARKGGRASHRGRSHYYEGDLQRFGVVDQEEQRETANEDDRQSKQK